MKSSLSIALLMMACGCQNPDENQAPHNDQAKGDINFINVSFSYDGEKSPLKNINLKMTLFF